MKMLGPSRREMKCLSKGLMAIRADVAQVEGDMELIVGCQAVCWAPLRFPCAASSSPLRAGDPDLFRNQPAKVALHQRPTRPRLRSLRKNHEIDLHRSPNEDQKHP